MGGQQGKDESGAPGRQGREMALALYKYAFRLTGDREMAQDLAQGAFAKILERREPVPGETDAEKFAYLSAVLLNQLRDSKRANKAVVVSLEALPPGDDLTWIRALRDLEGDALHQALRRLKPREQSLLVMKYYMGLDNKEIAQQLGVAPNSVRALQVRALARLKRELLASGMFDDR